MTENAGSNIYQRTFIWDERNMLTQSSDSLHTVKYRYGVDGQRTNKYSVTGDKGESIYFNKLWTWRKDSFTPSSGNYCKNIFLDKTRIVTKVRAADETSSADAHREYFYHGDHLQSATLITDYEGAVYERINYTPYGELWLEKSDNNGENYLPYRFTGKELDSETGLYYYGARYLDPMYSRWISTDPALGEYIPQAPVNDEAKKHNQNLPGMGGVFNTVNMNLYHYAGNNPIKYVDPDGNFDLPYMSPKDFFSFLLEHDSSAKAVKLYADAANGDKAAQALAKDVTAAAGKELAADGLEGVATVAEFSGGALSDLALESALIAPELSSGAGTASTICSGVEVAARVGKAAITGKQEDIDKAKKTAKKNTATSIAGATPGIVLRKLPAPITNFLGNISSKFVEDKMKNEGSDAEQK